MSYFGSTEWLIEVALGNVPGYSGMQKFGSNPDVDTGAAEDIWDFGGLYTFSTSADIDRVISTSASDTGDITILGLDTNWAVVSQTLTLTGQTAVVLTTNLIRVYRAYNAGASDFVGNISVYVDDTTTSGVVDTPANVRAYVAGANNQTLMAIFPIPAATYGILTNAYVTFGRGKTTTASADMSMRMRPFGGVFQIKNTVGLMTAGSSSFVRDPGVFGLIPAKTDILIRCDEVSAADCNIAAGFDLLLVDI